MLRLLVGCVITAAISLATAGVLATRADGGAVGIQTAHWYVWACNGEPGGCTRTTPQNADYTANECGPGGANSLYCFGEYIWGNGPEFAEYCVNDSPSTIATRMRYWADRARANGPGWRVYTWREGGGNPMACTFSIIQLY